LSYPKCIIFTQFSVKKSQFAPDHEMDVHSGQSGRAAERVPRSGRLTNVRAAEPERPDDLALALPLWNGGV